MIHLQMNCRRMMQRNGAYFAAALFLFLSAATEAQAAEENGDSTGLPASEIFKWINFAVLIVLIIWAWNRWATPGLIGSRQRIASAIASATAAKAEADRQLREAETKLANMKQEINALRATAQKDGVAEGERIRNQTASDAKKISAAAETEIEAAERAAQLELKAIAARLAVDGAEALLVKQLTPAEQDAVVANFAKSLEGKAN